MQKLSSLFFTIAIAGLAVVTPAKAQSHMTAPAFSEEECHVSGVMSAVRCYSLVRPLYSGSSDTTILRGIIVPSDAIVPESDPLIILTGGPGQAASDMVPMMHNLFRAVLNTRDLIFFDIRGTGLSDSVSCIYPDDDFELLGQLDLGLVTEQLQRCFRDHGDKLQDATTKMAVADIDALRRALGVEQVNLWGVSYGSRLAQYYINEHETRVRSAILDGVVPFAPSYINQTPTYALQALNKMTQDCAANAGCAAAFPAFDPLLLMDQIAEEQEITYFHPVSNDRVTVTINRDSVAQVIFTALYSPQSRAFIPYVLTQAITHDNWGPLAVLADDPNRYFGIQTIYAGARFSIICSEEQTNLNSASDGSNAFQSGATLKALFSTACDQWPMKNEPLPSPKVGAFSVPTILISGALDPITPPDLAEHSLKYFQNAQHIILKNGAHFNSHVPCIRDYLVYFIEASETSDIELDCIGDGYMPAFITGGARQAVGHNKQ